MNKDRLKNIPNMLSVLRIILVFVYVAVFFFANKFVAAGVFLLAGITDIIDGYLARKNNWVTNAGKILDPIADKLMQCAALVCLTVANMVPLWFSAPYILKEVLMLLGGLFMLKKRDVHVVSNVFGKIAAVLFYAVIILVMLLSEPWQSAIPAWTNFICGVSLGATVFAMIFYAAQYGLIKTKKNNDGNVGKE